ncbi:MAG: hypothetical protein KAS95_09010 [Candidatus Heimdallarchaeota archaeon]|nr:hypothetical protein [Candidatus Heimdallarchaeota archaeon]
MAGPVFIPSLVSMFITMAFFGIVIFLLTTGVRSLNRRISNIRLRRKLTAAKMIGEQKQAQ